MNVMIPTGLLILVQLSSTETKALPDTAPECSITRIEAGFVGHIKGNFLLDWPTVHTTDHLLYTGLPLPTDLLVQFSHGRWHGVRDDCENVPVS